MIEVCYLVMSLPRGLWESRLGRHRERNKAKIQREVKGTGACWRSENNRKLVIAVLPVEWARLSTRSTFAGAVNQLMEAIKSPFVPDCCNLHQHRIFFGVLSHLNLSTQTLNTFLDPVWHFLIISLSLMSISNKICLEIRDKRSSSRTCLICIPLSLKKC